MACWDTVSIISGPCGIYCIGLGSTSQGNFFHITMLNYFRSYIFVLFHFVSYVMVEGYGMVSLIFIV